MQPPCVLQLAPCGPPPSLGSQETPASLQLLGEKQLFEKFWKGTFKAVATPRPESVIAASITSQRRVHDSETTTTTTQPVRNERKAVDTQVDTVVDATYRNGSGRKRHHWSRRTAHGEVIPHRPKGKKKKRKSERRRKRKRSPSYSLSPLRKRKKRKKKKKSSKRSKRHRYTSKKSKHSSSSLKHKRKEERKHKKSSRTHSRRRRRSRSSESDASSYQSSSEDRHHLQRSVVHQAFGDLAAVGEDTRMDLNHTGTRWRRITKSMRKTAHKYPSALSAGTILRSKSGRDFSRGSGSQDRSGHNEGARDYDSGNDTSSPPSSKTGASGASAGKNKRGRCGHVTSPEKLRSADRDSASDSGNSATSYTSSSKPYGEDSFSTSLLAGNRREQITSGCPLEAVSSPKTTGCERRRSRSARRWIKARSSSSRSRSRSRSRSSGTSRYSGRYSRNSSLSSWSSFSRSLSNPSDPRRRGSVASVSSRGSCSRYINRKRPAGSRKADAKHPHKVGRKRGRRKSYSPMKKRRRDSPSHLEARRITSARKRPIPYLRPSPDSSSRSPSVSSWSSLFTRSRSRSHSRSRSPLYSFSRSRTRTRSRSYSSYRSYSRSSSWNSIFGTRGHNRSPGSLKKRRRHRH